MQEEPATASVDSRRLPERFGVLSNPFFRLFWLSMFASFLASQVQLVSQGWLVLELTNSPFYLGLVGGAAGLPVLAFSLFGGAIADRVERRKLLILCQGTMSGLKLGLAVLVLTGQVQVWHVLVVAMALGCVLAFNDPARQAFVTELVKPEKFLSAISLTATATNVTRIGGPVVAGALIGAFGLGLTYVVNGAVSVLAAVTLWPIPKSVTGVEARKTTVWSNVAEGLTFVRGNKTLLFLLIFAGLPGIPGAVSTALVPVFARDILDVGAIGLGQIMGAMGLGALAGSLAIASVGNLKHKGIIFPASAMLHNATAIVFAYSTWFPLSLAAAVVMGFASAGWMASVTTLLQVHTPNELRGRVMGLYLLTMQSVQVAQILGGTLASLIGAPYAVALTSAFALAMNFSALVVTPVIRRLD